MPWHTLLVLGGIGSGHPGVAAALAATAGESVHRVAAEPGAGLASLAQHLSEHSAAPQDPDVLLVDGVADTLATGGRADRGHDPTVGLAALIAALSDRPAGSRTVLVSAEAGLSPPPSTAANRRYVEAVGELNRALAEVADAVVLVVAGQPVWLKGGGAAPAVAAVATVTTAAQPPVSSHASLDNLAALAPPDSDARAAAAAHLGRLGAVGFGVLGEVVQFVAAGQRRAVPSPWQQVRVVVLQGDHPGDAAAGALTGADRAAALRDGTAPLAALAAGLGAHLQLAEVPASGVLGTEPAISEPEVEAGLVRGWQLAEAAADDGAEALVLASIGAGAETAAAAVTAAIAPSTEPSAMLGRFRAADGTIDDLTWIRRCATVRDAVHRARTAGRTSGRPVLAELGGHDLAVATGLVLGAAARQLPVLVDGPVGAAATLVARNLAAAVRHWCLVPDTGGHPLVRRAAEILGITPLTDLRLELGEGAGSLTVLPVLRAGLTLAGTLPTTPDPAVAGSGAPSDREVPAPVDQDAAPPDDGEQVDHAEPTRAAD